LPTIRAEQLRENIRKPADLICRPWYGGVKSWASCHRRQASWRYLAKSGLPSNRRRRPPSSSVIWPPVGRNPLKDT